MSLDRNCFAIRRAVVPVAVLAALGMSTAVGAGDDRVDYNRDVRPILSNKCVFCHGPDEAEQKANLRIDVEASAKADRGGYAAIVPGDPVSSELIYRVESEDELEVMPPASSNKTLSDAEKATLRRWIAQGADYKKHWSYESPTRPDVPEVSREGWSRNAIDRFVQQRLEAAGMEPSSEADRAALIRRVSLDLTGLPPTPEEVDAFLLDDEPEAYERLVDRLLASPRYGEHMARGWLDLARYADSAGYADDPQRTIWAYRDYVIASFNENKPFDRFTVEQSAATSARSDSKSN